MFIDRFIAARLKAPQDSFEEAFLSELLISEKLRLTILSGLFSLTAVGVYFSPDFFKIQFPLQGALHGLPLHKWVAGFWALVALYEFFVSRLFALLKKNNRQPPTGALYMNAIVEAAIPTGCLHIASRHLGADALLTPLPFVYFIFIALSALRLNFMISLVMGLVASVGYGWVALDILAGQPVTGCFSAMSALYIYTAKSGVLLIVGMTAGFVGSQIRRRVVGVMEAAQEQNRIEKIFGQHVSPELVERLLSGEMEMESETRQVCVLFLDIRGFTNFSHANTPEAVVAYLNTLFDEMITIINRHHGIINKFLGDGFMAIFGAPVSTGDIHRNAVRAALEITAWVDRETAADRIPPTRTGIGIHAGEVVTGHVGSELRKEYTVIGDAVNLASRIESLNKTYGTRILVSETVWAAVRDEVRSTGEFGPVQVKGRSEPIKVYALA